MLSSQTKPNTREVIFQTDARGNWTFLSPAWFEITGFTLTESIGEPFFNFVHPEDRQLALAQFNSLIENSVEFNYQEIKYITKQGSEIWMGIQTQLTFASDGDINGTCGTLKQIYQRQQAEEDLQQSYPLLLAVIEGTNDAIFVKDIDCKYILVNATAASVLGKSREEIIGKDDREFFCEENARQIMETDCRIMTTGQSEIIEEMVSINNSNRRYLSTKYVYRDRNGNVKGLIGISRDITEQKILETEKQQLIETIQQEKEDLLAITKVTSNAISTLNLNELLDILLKRIVEVIQADTAVILLKAGNDLIVRASVGIEGEVESKFTVPIGQGFAGTIGATMEYLYVEDTQTSAIPISQLIQQVGIHTMLGVPLKRDNRLIGVLHVDWLNVHPFNLRELHLLEITAERCSMAILNAQLFEETKHLQERLQLQIDKMPVGYIITDKNFCFVEWNLAAERIFGFTKKEVIDKYYDLIVPSSVKPYINEICQRLLQGDMTAHSLNENITKDGRRIICEWYNTPLKDPNGEIIGFQSMVQDITDRKQAEAALLDSQQRYAMAVNAGKVGVWDWNLQTNEIYIDPSLKGMLGYEDWEIINHIDIWTQLVHPEDRTEVMVVAQAHLEGFTPEYKIEHRMLHKDGSFRWFLACGVAIRDANGNCIRMMGTDTDITEQQAVLRERKQAEEELRESENRYRTLFQNNPHPMWVYDLETLVFLDVNDAAICHYGYSRAEFLAMTIGDIRPSEDLPILLENIAKVSSGVDLAGVWRHRKKDGTIIYVEISSHTLLFSGRNAEVVLANNVTERLLAEQALRESESRYHTLAKISPVGIFRTDEKGNVLYVNERWCIMSGLKEAQALEQGWSVALHIEDRERVLAQWHKAVEEKQPFESEYRYLRPDGVITWVFTQTIAEMAENGELLGYVGTITDITQRKQNEELLQYYAFHDPLTGLPNRTLFLERTRQAIASAKTDETGLFAVLLLDLDRFQMVKSSLGHSVADQLLFTTAERISSCLNVTDMAARVGLDEFAILLTNLNEITDANRIAEQIYQALSIPFTLNNHEVFVTASIGIAISSIGYERSEDLLRAADMARNQVKSTKKGGYALFELEWHTKAVQRLWLETDLRRAIEREELRVYYQPIISLKTGKITGFEALVRWQHPKRGLVFPGEFIPLAEETGLIVLIDRWVLQEACRQIALWQQAFPDHTPLTISVNLSGFQLSQIGLIERIDQIIQESGIQRESLKLEITETILLGNHSSEKAMLEQLKSLGIQLLIDDFGTGYSSLARLHQLPIDTLKIDRSFVNGIEVNPESTEIIRTIISLAHILDMDVIAEGVETAEQLAQLRSLQCESGQGYFISQPVDKDAAEDLLRSDWQF